MRGLLMQAVLKDTSPTRRAVSGSQLLYSTHVLVPSWTPNVFTFTMAQLIHMWQLIEWW